jgi:predicted HicB family RNase H-like nuclease
MAKKPASLEAALGGHSQPVAPDTAEVVQHPSASTARPGKPQETKLTVYVPPAASKRLRLMCIEHDRDLNSYLREGLDMVLAKYGQPSLAEFSEK